MGDGRRVLATRPPPCGLDSAELLCGRVHTLKTLPPLAESSYICIALHHPATVSHRGHHRPAFIDIAPEPTSPLKGKEKLQQTSIHYQQMMSKMHMMQSGPINASQSRRRNRKQETYVAAQTEKRKHSANIFKKIN